MMPLDRVLQNWRIRKAALHIPPNVRLLDLGCADGALVIALGSRLASGIGLDPDAPVHLNSNAFTFVRGRFPEGLPSDTPPFDAVTALAVLEHIPEDLLTRFADACGKALRPGGRLILTVPSPAVDTILAILKALRLVDGMALEEHHAFNPARVIPLFEGCGLVLVFRKRFQFGLNNLFVFERTLS